MRLEVDEVEGVLIEGTEQELADLASSLLEAAVLGEIDEHLLTDDGVATVRIRRLEEEDEVLDD
jgi:hypothetical protein